MAIKDCVTNHCSQLQENACFTLLRMLQRNTHMMKRGDLKVRLLGCGFAWLNAGKYESLLEAGIFIQSIEYKQDFKFAYSGEIAYQQSWLNKQKNLATPWLIT